MRERIYRDEALKALCKICNKQHPSEKELCPNKFQGCLEYYTIFELQTADEQEEPLGEWIKTGEFFDCSFLMESWKCSSCGIEVTASEPYYNINLWHYCPNCGDKKRAVKHEK